MAPPQARRPAGWIVYLIVGAGAISAYYALPRAGVGQAVVLTVLNGTAAVTAFRAATRTHGQTRVVWVALGVTSERRGRNVVYRLADDRVEALLRLAESLAEPNCDHLASCQRIGPDWI